MKGRPTRTTVTTYHRSKGEIYLSIEYRRSSLNELPIEITTLDVREFTPVMAALSSIVNVNFLAAEAVATASQSVLFVPVRLCPGCSAIEPGREMADAGRLNRQGRKAVPKGRAGSSSARAPEAGRWRRLASRDSNASPTLPERRADPRVVIGVQPKTRKAPPDRTLRRLTTANER